MEKSYAQALFQLIEGGMKPHDALAQLRETLERHGRSALLPKIGKAFQRLAEKALAGKEVRLIVADEKDAKLAVKEAAEALELSDGDMRVCTDTSLIGGWRIETKELLMDASYKQYLLSVFNAATRA